MALGFHIGIVLFITMPLSLICALIFKFTALKRVRLRFRPRLFTVLSVKITKGRLCGNLLTAPYIKPLAALGVLG